MDLTRDLLYQLAISRGMTAYEIAVYTSRSLDDVNSALIQYNYILPSTAEYNQLVVIGNLCNNMATQATLAGVLDLLGGPGKIKDNGPGWTSSRGVSGVPISEDISAAPTAVTDAPTTGQKIVIDDVIVGSTVAQTLTFTEETSGTVLFMRRIPAGQSQQFTMRGKIKLATADKKVMCRSSAAGTTDVEINYHSEA